MCYNRFFFHPVHMGEKHKTTDIFVELIDSTYVQSIFYIQVKSTTRGYTGAGTNRRLNVDVPQAEVEMLKKYPGPSYIVGIDIRGGRGYIIGVVAGLSGAISGLPTLHPINCRTIRSLWNEVDTYWNSTLRSMPMVRTRFST
jgi:hypothetical protein